MKRWDWEDEKPLWKWISTVGSSQYNRLHTIGLKASNTFGSLLYEKEDALGYRFCCSNLYSDKMKKVLGTGGTVEVSVDASYAEIYLNSRGQCALDRTNHFNRVVSLMRALGHDCAYNYAEHTGALWFSVKTTSQSAYEKGISDFDRILRQVFGLQ